MKKLGLILILLITFTSFANADSHPDLEVKVNGMVRDFCAHGLKKSFGKKEAVEKIDVSLEKGDVSIWLKDGQNLTDDEVQKAIVDNGISVVSVQREKNEKE